MFPLVFLVTKLIHTSKIQIFALLALLLAYAYTCDVQPRPASDNGNPLIGFCNLISITKASPLTHFVVIGYFIVINIQIASILTEDNSPSKVRTFLLFAFVGFYVHKISFLQDLMLAILGFFFHLTAGSLVISRWKDVAKDTDGDRDDYHGKGLGLGCVLIFQSFAMLAEAGLQALRGNVVQVVN